MIFKASEIVGYLRKNDVEFYRRCKGAEINEPSKALKRKFITSKVGFDIQCKERCIVYKYPKYQVTSKMVRDIVTVVQDIAKCSVSPPNENVSKSSQKLRKRGCQSYYCPILPAHFQNIRS